MLLPVGYLVVALILSGITVNNTQHKSSTYSTIYLQTNGVHMDIILPYNTLSNKLKKGLITNPNYPYMAFGWGDKEFYLNTPTWRDLTLKTALTAIFFQGESLMHIKQYGFMKKKWVPIKISKQQLQKLNNYIAQTFKYESDDKKVLLANKGYGVYDHFYKAKGSYSIINTCNTWVNRAFKESDLKACLWTPFDFLLIGLYEWHIKILLGLYNI